MKLIVQNISLHLLSFFVFIYFYLHQYDSYITVKTLCNIHSNFVIFCFFRIAGFVIGIDFEVFIPPNLNVIIIIS